MKRGIVLLLAAVIIAGCYLIPQEKKISELKIISEAKPEKIISGIYRSGVEIPISKFGVILPYGDSSLLFLNKKEKLVFITDNNMKVIKEIDLKGKLDSLYSVLDLNKKTRDYYAADKKKTNYDSLRFSIIENAFITGDTLILASGLQYFNKLILSTGEIRNVLMEKSYMASPYNLYINRKGNYVLTYFGMAFDDLTKSGTMPPADDKKENEYLKESKALFGDGGVITGTEITSGGKLVRQIKLQKRDYGHNLPQCDYAFYADTENGYCLYFSASKNIIFYNNAGVETGRKEFPAADEWFPPKALDESKREIKYYLVNSQRLIPIGKYLLQPSPFSSGKEGAVLVKYNSEYEPLGIILLKETARSWGYKIFKWGNYLAVYPERGEDDKMYLFAIKGL